LGHYLIAMKMKLSEAYLQCQDKSGRLGGMAGSVVLYVIARIYINKRSRLSYISILARVRGLYTNFTLVVSIFSGDNDILYNDFLGIYYI
jgi:hypothetical protein